MVFGNPHRRQLGSFQISRTFSLGFGFSSSSEILHQRAYYRVYGYVIYRHAFGLAQGSGLKSANSGLRFQSWGGGAGLAGLRDLHLVQLCDPDLRLGVPLLFGIHRVLYFWRKSA